MNTPSQHFGSYHFCRCPVMRGDRSSPFRTALAISARESRVQALSFMCSELQVLSLESYQVVAQRQQRRDVDEQDLEAARRVLKSDSGERNVSDERLRALAVLFTLRRVLQVTLRLKWAVADSEGVASRSKFINFIREVSRL